MALHPHFPDDPHAILDPAIRWFPADEALRTTSFEKLLPPLLPTPLASGDVRMPHKNLSLAGD